jgi:hypothetical protein
VALLEVWELPAAANFLLLSSVLRQVCWCPSVLCGGLRHNRPMRCGFTSTEPLAGGTSCWHVQPCGRLCMVSIVQIRLHNLGSHTKTVPLAADGGQQGQHAAQRAHQGAVRRPPPPGRCLRQPALPAHCAAGRRAVRVFSLKHLLQGHSDVTFSSAIEEHWSWYLGSDMSAEGGEPAAQSPCSSRTTGRNESGCGCAFRL